MVIYTAVFVYFSLVHVPFKNRHGDGIKYDTLLSDVSNLDVSRFIIVLAILSILTVVLLFLFQNFKLSVKSFRIRKIKPVFIYSVLLLIFLSCIFVIDKYQNNKKTTVQPSRVTSRAKEPMDSSSLLVSPEELMDSTTVERDSQSSKDVPPFVLKRIATCTKENALKQFKSYMKFYYPDWKISGKPVVIEQSDCTYRIQFTTNNPHFSDREIMIAQISFNYDYSTFNFEMIRGVLY